MKLLHIIQDEKFPDSAYEFFEAVVPGQSTYMMSGKLGPIKHLHKITPVRFSRFAFFSNNFIKYVSNYDAIILHSLTPFSLEVLARIKSKIPVMWIGMGYDYYDIVSGKADVLLKLETQKVYNSTLYKVNVNPVEIMKAGLKRVFYANSKRKKQLIKKIDLFAPVLQSEHSLVKTAVGEPFPEYIRWNYGKIADLVDGMLGSKRVSGKNILVGNSATPTNNHIDAFLRLAEVGVPERSKIIVPLSYGDLSYRKKVLQEGERLFGKQFMPITDFLSFEKYIDLLISCSSVFMNHLRQQGAGNLFISLYLGARVYLDPHNPLYNEFNSMGLSVNTLSMMDGQSLDEPLDSETTSEHQEILRQARGRKAFEQYTRNMIARLEQLHHEKLA